MTRIVALLWDEGLSPAGSMALGTALDLAARLNASAEVFTVNPSQALAAELQRFGLASVLALQGDADGGDLVTPLAARIGAGDIVIAARGPRAFSVLPRLAKRTGGSCVMGVVDLSVEAGVATATAAVFGGAAHAVYRMLGDGPRIVSLTNGPRAVTPEAASTTPIEYQPIPADPRITVISPASRAAGPQLESAPVVVSGGRGLRDRENYALVRELAAALGGMPGASRAIVDDGWAAPAQQVGLTGTVVTPELYIAAGISGASQHMAGCSNARAIVAINTDPEAPIFRYAHLGIVGDCLEVLPALIELAKSRPAAR